MVLPSSDGGSAAGQVQVVIAEIEAIARKSLPAAEDDASLATQDFRNLELDPSSFGEVPIARNLGIQHGAAHEVFVSTVDAVLQDLRDFAATLSASMKAHQATDEGVHSALAAVSVQYRDHGSKAAKEFEKKLIEQGDALHVDAPQADAQPPAAAPSGEGATTGSTEQTSGTGY
ncbi:MAG: hypothetical protein ABIN79_06920 [Marmoricola sp.]